MKNVLVLFLVCIFFSCENWLDVSPKSDIKAEDLFSKERGFEDAMVGVYSLMTLPDLYGANLSFGYVDVLARYYRIGTKSSFYEASRYDYENSSEESRLASIWELSYKGIANLNSVLNYIDERKDVFSGDSYYLYKGEALALRAMLHFDVLRLFAPSIKLGENEAAIPYMDSYTYLAQKRLTVREVLNLIIEDLNEARDLMRPYDPYGPLYTEDDRDDTPEGVTDLKSRMRYYSATALLSRVYLYAGEKENALAAVKEIVGEADGELLPIFQMAASGDVADPLFDSEIIFELNKANLPDEIDDYFGDEAAAMVNTDGSKFLQMKLEDKTKMYTTFNPADMEFREIWFKGAGNDASYVTLSKLLSMDKIPMLRVSELFLIAAECAPSVVEQLKYMNRYRVHRGLSEIDEVGDAIHEEYRKEFIGEGQMFFYYKRKNMTGIGVDDKVIEAEKVYVLPLPSDELDLGNN